MEILSMRIKQLRHIRGMSQKELADLVYVDRTTIAGYESGKKDPNLHILIRIADVLNATTDYLLGRTDNMN